MAGFPRDSIYADFSSRLSAPQSWRQAPGLGGYSGSDALPRDAASAPRRFSVVNARVRTFAAAAFAILLALAASTRAYSANSSAKPASQTPPSVDLIVIDGSINPAI